LLKSDGRAS